MLTLLVSAVLLGSLAPPDIVTVADDASLRIALREARPGTTIRIAPGTYTGGLFFDRSGTEQQPVVIEAADPAAPPVIEGGGNAIHLAGCSWVTLRNLRLKGQRDNGLNADDGGRMDGSGRGIVLEDLHVSDTNPVGNHDGIKLSGLTGFRVIGCTISGWGGSAIDLVGCHNGVIEGCTLRGADERGTGIQLKGGTSDVVVRGCDFIHAGHRALNLGGSTGLAYFRPQDATAEARDLLVEECRFVGSMSPIAFVGSEVVVVRRNLFLHPKRWIIRILQETTDERFVPSRNGRFEENIIVFRSTDLENHHVNVGPNTEPGTFTFARNQWYCEDQPSRSRPQLPATEKHGTYGVKPPISVDESGLPVRERP